MGPGEHATAANDAAPATATPVRAPQESVDAWHDRRDNNMTGLRGRS
jgi:hypothetical protein